MFSRCTEMLHDRRQSRRIFLKCGAGAAFAATGLSARAADSAAAASAPPDDALTALYAAIRNQTLLSAEASPVISRAVRRHEVVVAGGVYDLYTGIVTPVNLECP